MKKMAMVLAAVLAMLVALCAAAEVPAVEADSLIGEWDIAEILGDEVVSQELAQIKAAGGYARIVFTDAELILYMGMQERAEEIHMEYLNADGMIVIEDGSTLPYAIEDSRLIMDGEGGQLVLERVTDGPTIAEIQAQQELAAEKTVTGLWNLVSIEGTAEGASYFEMVNKLGGGIELQISEHRAVMSVVFMGKVVTSSGSLCTIDGDTAYMEDGAVCELQGDQLIFTADGVTMVYERK